MQENIKELENVTEGLQNELQNKESVFEVLKRENNELQDRLNQREQDDSSQQVIRRLEDELTYIKRQHDLEVNMLKDQHSRNLSTARLITNEAGKMNQNSS